MIHQTEELLRLILEKTPSGLALLDKDKNPLISNPQFEQLCIKFSEKIWKGNFGLPEIIAEKIKDYTSNGDHLKKIHFITASDNTNFVLSIESIHHRSNHYFLVTLSQKRLREFELYLVLKGKYAINEKEFEIICLAKKGFNNIEIAKSLKSSEASVKSYFSRIYKKFEVANRSELIGVLEDFSNS